MIVSLELRNARAFFSYYHPFPPMFWFAAIFLTTVVIIDHSKLVYHRNSPV